MSSRFVEPNDFDTKLFKFNVGRVEIQENDFQLLQKFPTLHDILGQAHSSGYRLVYIFAPVIGRSLSEMRTMPPSIPMLGTRVDVKTTYSASLLHFDRDQLCQNAFLLNNVRIRKHNPTKNPIPTQAIRDLAVASGVWSRFKIDSNIPVEGFEALFEAWIKNSYNRSIADEIFIAYDIVTNEEVGFITVKNKGNNVNIGLLAVSSAHRRKKIASSLLSRAVLWALEEIGWNPDATVNVVTQGANQPACMTYESFGFTVDSTQDIYHVWLPDHLVQPVSRADQGPIPFCKQHMTGKESLYANQVLSTGQLDSAAHYTLKCSAKIHDLLGSDSERVVMVPSGTAALEMAALMCNLEAGDEVIMPSFTFSSTANAFVLRRAVPVFVDVKVDTLNIDESLIEAAITEKTKAICVVHYAGVPCEMDTICAIAKKYNLFVVEDAAQSFLSTYKGRQLGTIGDFGCFSFHYTKNVMCGEGGALSVNRSPENAKRALVLWEKGTNRYDFVTGKVDKYHWIDIGSSFVPSELSCAVLYAQLEDCQTITHRRIAHFQAYSAGLSTWAARNGFRIPVEPPQCTSNAHIFYFLLTSEDEKTFYERELKKKGISAFSHYCPLHSAPAGLKYGRTGSAMTVTDSVHSVLLRLPIWIGMSAEDVQHVVSAVQSVAVSREVSSSDLDDSRK